MVIECNGCPTTWTAKTYCHCGACHETFSGLDLFDRHRRNGTCHAPASVRGVEGYRVMWEHDGVWHGSKTPPDHSALEKARAARKAKSA